MPATSAHALASRKSTSKSRVNPWEAACQPRLASGPNLSQPVLAAPLGIIDASAAEDDGTWLYPLLSSILLNHDFLFCLAHFLASSFRSFSVPQTTSRCMVECDMVRRTMAVKFRYRASRKASPGPSIPPIFPILPYLSLPSRRDTRHSGWM